MKEQKIKIKMRYLGPNHNELIGIEHSQLRGCYFILLGARYGAEIPARMKVVPQLKNDLIDRITDIQVQIGTRNSVKEILGAKN